MVVLRVILGIMLIMCSFSVLAIPALSAVVLCWMVSIFMLVAGIFAIVNFIETKNAERVAKKNGMAYLKTGIGSLVFGIIAIVVSIISRSSIDANIVFLRIISVLFGLWIVLDGVSLIVAGDAKKKIAASGWIGLIVLGVIAVLLGIACIVNGFASLIAMGTMFGISMMFSGISLIFGVE